jgi:hypothetical protein
MKRNDRKLGIKINPHDRKDRRWFWIEARVKVFMNGSGDCGNPIVAVRMYFGAYWTIYHAQAHKQILDAFPGTLRAKIMHPN